MASDRELKKLHQNVDYFLLSNDSHKEFNQFPYQRMTYMPLYKVPSLCFFLNMVYARRKPMLILPSGPASDISSEDGIRQGDPASMLIFSIFLHPLSREIEARASLRYHHWYRDD